MTQTVSIAMATYNGARFLKEQLDSLIAQDLRPAEIIICDDGSTDDTIQVATAYAAASPVPVQVVQNEKNLGWRANFIKSASLCTGDLIAFCDQDDVWNPRKLSEVVQRFEQPAVLMVYHNAEVVDGELRHKGTLSMQKPEANVMPAMTLDPWISMLGLTIAFRRELLQFWPLWEDSIDKYASGHRAAHDQWVCFLASSLGTTVYTDQQLLKYRQHGGNAMGVALTNSKRHKIAYILDFAKVIDLYHATAETRILALSAIPTIDPRFTECALRAKEIYIGYRDLLALQLDVYRSAALPRRLSAAAQLRRLDAYRGSRWSLTQAMRYKDLFASIAGPSVLKTLHGVVTR